MTKFPILLGRKIGSAQQNALPRGSEENRRQGAFALVHPFGAARRCVPGHKEGHPSWKTGFFGGNFRDNAACSGRAYSENAKLLVVFKYDVDNSA